MADATAIHRRYLKASIGALCLEKGFNAVTRQSIETLTEMIQSYLGEIGRSSLAICELSGRSKPTLNDVKLALIEMGFDVDEIKLNTAAARKISKPTPSYITQQSKPLQSGTKEALPSYVPNYLPPFPDPHSYIKTLNYRNEAEEYALCRDKYAAMRRDVEAGLAKFLARTSSSKQIVKNCSDADQYLLMVNEPTPHPYLKALMPCAEDQIVVNNVNKSEKQESDNTNTEKTEIQDNPYLKPTKKLKT